MGVFFFFFEDFFNVVVCFVFIYFNFVKVDCRYRLIRSMICKVFLYYILKDYLLFLGFDIYRNLV